MIKLLGLVVVVTALPSPCGANAAAAVSANLKISIVSPISCDNGDPLAVPSMAAAAGLPLRAQRRFQQSRRRVQRYRQVYRWLRCDRHRFQAYYAYSGTPVHAIAWISKMTAGRRI